VEQELLVTALRDSVRLSNLRCNGGLDSCLQVLDAKRNLFQGDLDLARLKRNELISVVSLYRALGATVAGLLGAPGAWAQTGPSFEDRETSGRSARADRLVQLSGRQACDH
jgi:hypothetical protein